MHNPTNPSAAVILLMATAVILAKVDTPLPIWPEVVGHTPSIGTALLVAAVVVGAWRLYLYTTQAVSSIRDSLR